MFMLTSTHRAAMAKARADDQAALSEYAADLKRANDARDNWRDSSKEWEAKFKKAVTELAAETEMVRGLTDKNVELIGKLETARGERDAAMTDAQKWRDSLKRSRDRKAAKKSATPPARDKRAKNRGGGK